MNRSGRSRSPVCAGRKLQAGLKASTINTQLTVLQKLLRTAVEWGQMQRRDDTWKLRLLPEPSVSSTG